ncbi:universal stress protein [Streptomyces sp. NA02950]|uniref:universal stress protein n=1 Tax=Streptomyces sp. NA02950 TaxID=2742137 RepID=UPI0020CA9CC3|nr:universal stress protein [Streptomyces sp. NA02950]
MVVRPRITVGIDGFPESPHAAPWAAREALPRDLPLRLVHAWVLLAPTDPDPPPEGDLPCGNDQAYWARRLLSDTVGALREAPPGLNVTAEPVPQETVPALLAAGGAAEMLVLGSRGRGALGGFLLGSTGREVLARGVRPMVLLHADDADRSADVAVGPGPRRPPDDVLGFAFDAAARRGGSLRAVHAGGRRQQGGAERGAAAVAGEVPGGAGGRGRHRRAPRARSGARRRRLRAARTGPRRGRARWRTADGPRDPRRGAPRAVSGGGRAVRLTRTTDIDSSATSANPPRSTAS